MAVVAEAYEAQTTITKAMLPLLQKLALLEAFEFMRRRFRWSVTLVQVRRHR